MLDLTFPRTLDGLLRAPPAPVFEAWLFEDEAPRRVAERALAARGIRARLRSAYKPLLHWALEDADLAGVTLAEIHLPAHPAAAPHRFQLEAYPLAALFPHITWHFRPGTEPLHYQVVLHRAAGPETHRVFAPNRLRDDAFGTAQLCPCGWLGDAPLPTEFEQAFDAAMDALRAQPWEGEPPWFDVLHIQVETGGIERPLPFGEECVSTREALHEDLYFSALELVQHRAGKPPGFRGLRPGQLVPDITASLGDTRVRITARPALPAPPPDAAQSLAAPAHPLSEDDIAAALDALGGEPFRATSAQSRPVLATHLPGTGAPLLITAGQHANETTGVVGALRAARALRDQGRHFALIAQENPDGYALHRHLRAAHPAHMHHAARYTALGDDLGVRVAAPWHETAARIEAARRTGARLHVNLHGYPAHEWTRPLSGYVPRGFGLWTLPKGFFLILYHRPGLEAGTWDFLRAVAAAAATPALAALNRTQLSAWNAHSGGEAPVLLDGIPCTVSPREDLLTDWQLITEYPDETVYGDAFRLGCDTQERVVLAAAEAFPPLLA